MPTKKKKKKRGPYFDEYLFEAAFSLLLIQLAQRQTLNIREYFEFEAFLENCIRIAEPDRADDFRQILHYPKLEKIDPSDVAARFKQSLLLIDDKPFYADEWYQTFSTVSTDHLIEARAGKSGLKIEAKTGVFAKIIEYVQNLLFLNPMIICLPATQSLYIIAIEQHRRNETVLHSRKRSTLKGRTPNEYRLIDAFSPSRSFSKSKLQVITRYLFLAFSDIIREFCKNPKNFESHIPDDAMRGKLIYMINHQSGGVPYKGIVYEQISYLYQTVYFEQVKPATIGAWVRIKQASTDADAIFLRKARKLGSIEFKYKVLINRPDLYAPLIDGL